MPVTLAQYPEGLEFDQTVATSLMTNNANSYQCIKLQSIDCLKKEVQPID